MLSLAAAAGAAVTAPSAFAAAPWSEPASIPGSEVSLPRLAATSTGETLGLWLETPAVGVSNDTRAAVLSADGTFMEARHAVSNFAVADVAAYGRRRVLAAGTSQRAGKSRVAVVFGRADGTFGRPRLLSVPGGSAFVTGLAVNAAGDAAVVVSACANTRCGSRMLFLMRRGAGGSFGRAVELAAGPRVGVGDVAVNARGDVLVAWGQDDEVVARLRSAGGSIDQRQRLGEGFQALLSVALGSTRSAVVAWGSQYVSEGDALSPFVARAAYRSRRGRFGSAHELGRVNITGTGRYVAGPRVRATLERNRATVAYVSYVRERFVVQARDLDAPKPGAPQTVSPPDRDAVLAELSAGSRGEQLVTWVSGPRGADSAGAPFVVGATARPSGQPQFGALEDIGGISPAVPASALLDPVTGRALVAWSDLGAGIGYATRPAF